MPHRFAWLIAFACIGAMAADSNSIQVRVTGLPADEGNLFCALHDRPGGFPGTAQAVQTVTGTIAHREGICVFARVRPARYAVSVIHDRNANGEFDTWLFGIPSEPWAVSRDASASFSPPTFDDARFDYQGGVLTLTVKAR